MATTTARNRQDVDSMSKADRVWDSLNYSYGKKRESSDREYDKAISQADRQALSRGMQRSSYNNQVLANLSNQKVKAQGDIWDTQIADYENRLADIEAQEAEADRWERQFAEGQRQYDTSLAYQKERDAASDNQWNLQFNAGREDAAWNKAMQEKQYDAGRADTAWNQAFQQAQADESRRQYDTSLAYQQARDAVSDNQWRMQYDANRADTAWNQAFQQGQADTAKDQWERQFGYGQQSDAQQIAMQYALSILQNGQMPSDDMLARAGISRADAEKLIAQAKGSGRGSGNGSGNGNSEDGNGANGTTTTGNPDQDFLNLLGGSDANILYSMNVPAINKGNAQTKNTTTNNNLKRTTK